MIKSVLIGGILAVGLAQGALAASLQIGQSVDFLVDTSAVGAFNINGYGVSCNNFQLCPDTPTTGRLLDQGNGLDFSLGSVRGDNDLLQSRYVATASNVDSFFSPQFPNVGIPAGVTEIFIRVTATDQPMNVTGALVGFNDSEGRIRALGGTELAPVPLPAPALFLISALVGLLALPRR